MSQYRDHRDAARHRIDALEAKLTEREAEIAVQRATLSVREAEIGRLRRELDVTGALDGRARPLHIAWATRVTGLALGFAAIAGAVGVSVMRAPVAASAPAAASERAPAMEAPMLADPAPLAMDRDPPAAETAAPAETAKPLREGRVWGDPLEPAASPEAALRRYALERKVAAGHATVDDLRLLAAICAHAGDGPCRDRAAAALRRARAESR